MAVRVCEKAKMCGVFFLAISLQRYGLVVCLLTLNSKKGENHETQ